jgi:hypothetical protein
MKMKKVKVLFSVLFVLTVLLLQPFSANLKSLTSSNAISANASSEAKPDCLPCQNPDLTNGKGTSNKFQNQEIIKVIKKDTNDWHKNELSIYGVNDFEWNESVISDYENAPSVIYIPLKTNPNNDNKKGYMVVGYNKATGELHPPTLMNLDKKTDTKFDFTVGTLDGTNVARVTINTESQQAEKVEILTDKTALIQQNKASAGYWQDVQDCLEDRYYDLPSWAQWACKAACGGCLFANPYACGACLGCLSGYAIGCSLNP